MATQRGLFEERMSQRSSRSASARSPDSKGATGQVAASPAPAVAAAPAAAPTAADQAASSYTADSAAAAEGPPPGCWPKVGYYWFEFRWRVRQVVDHPAFGSLFMLLIIANTVLLAMTTAGMSATFAHALDVASHVLTFLFLAEVVLKLLGLGTWGFASDAFNVFDLVVVATGVLELALTMGANGNALRSFRTLRILRSFRVLRVLKIFRYLESLRIIAEVLMASMSQFLAVALLMVLFIFVFSLIGLQVFGQQSVALGSAMPSFLGFWNSFVAVFQILTLENWPDVMFQLQSVAGWPSVLFFVAWVTVGKYIILTLFLAITLAAFEQSYAQVSRTSTGSSIRRALNSLLALYQALTACCGCCGRLRRQRTAEEGDLSSARWKSSAQPEGVLDDGAPPELSEAAAKQAAAALSAAMSAKLKAAAALGGSTAAAAPAKVDNPVRGALYHLMTTQAMDYLLMLLVLLSCVEMGMETSHMDPAARRTHVLHWIDVGTTIAFALEALLKIVAFGFRPYIAFNSNKLDLGVVVVSAIVLIAESANARFLKALRVLRATRPLRVLTRSQSMLMVFHTLIRSLAEMANVTVLAGMVFLIFSILGVQLFAGLLWSCNDDSVAGKDECTGTFVDPATGDVLQREWTNAFYNFDNVGLAFLTLFVTATLDGYTRTMYATMASRSLPDVQPQVGSNLAAFLYWFTFITLCSFFVLNLCELVGTCFTHVGVVFFQYQRLKLLSETGSAVLTAGQTGYVEMLRAVFRWFDRFMLLTILLNIVLTATSFYGEPAGFIKAQEVANTVFSAFVLLELGVKLAAMGPRLYWRCNWNKLDVLLSIASAADIITQIVNAAAHTTVNLGVIKKVMMLARVLRMFRLLRHLRGVQMLLSTLIVSLPALWNVGALLFLLFFIYAYMGVLLFGQVAWREDLNAHANFTTFPDALLLLFRVATGDNWAALLRDCMVRPPECDPDAGNCGHTWAPAYFLSFYLSGALIALNLLTTVILETFERIQDTVAWALTPQHLEDFCELWAEYDDGTNAIDPKDLEQLLRRLPPPMGLGPRATESDVMRFVFSLDIPLNDRGLVPFHRTAYELVVRCTEAEIPEGELKRKLDRMIRRFLTRHTPAQQSEHMNFQVAITVMRIQRHWRAVAARRKAEREAQRPVPPSSPESQNEARESGTPDHVFAREEELDVRAVSHAERAAAHQHTFPELVHGQPGEEAVQHGMSEEQRQLMEGHLHPGAGPSGSQAPKPHVAAEDARAWGAPDTSGSQPSSGRPIQEPDASQPTSAAAREGGGTADASKAQQAPPIPSGMKPRQNRSPPVDDWEDES
ncbi:voltage-gated ion channel superfamily [Chlorella sorokiniana]|uniref:Voltage-gated ion channel superfamily n=1 Tax=Chlorella sorokiniana TaxID=3076 RepID=A0A2P6TEE5_CHLSO|nr:voltage-gated ion channel superfamily [Chlorella sorokiniana]|eukprot:PRW21007.1 voltage-gated ion channel superfamily [Chlorella sorokiniana]